MRIFYSALFQEDFLNLPKEIKKIAEKKLNLFGDNPRYSSLRIKKMGGLLNIWEGRITDNYRFTFLIEKDVYILRRIGTHDILRKEK